jgi:hypothetical protein
MKPIYFIFISILCSNSTYSQLLTEKKNKPSKPNSIVSRNIPIIEWTTGAMPDTTGNGTPTTTNLKQLVIPNANLKALGVTLGGPNLIVCNNPERFTGDGWLFQHSYTDATQGGIDYPLTGTTRIYMFHLNFTSPGATKYIHLVVHNPGASAITYTTKGAFYTNVDKPLSGAATGQSYWVSRDWISNTPTTSASTSLAANSKVVIFSKQVNSANMFDALFEITTSGPVYYYTVVTSVNTTAAAKAAAAPNTAYASFAVPPDPRVTQSDYRQETGGTYARGAGIFTASEVASDNVLAIPDVPSRIGFCFNTSSKFYPMLEKQNPAVFVKTPPTTDTVRSLYSSSHNYGNYGMYYNTIFRLQNNSSTTKTVNVYFAENENLVDAASASGRWNSRFKIDGTASASFDVYIQGNNPRKLLKTISVPTGTTNFTLEGYIPGLITTNHQLIFETTTTAAVTLPVQITDFSGLNAGRYNIINWKTEQESNISHYELERKTENSDFIKIKTIAAKNNPGQGNYNYTDSSVQYYTGKYYYRLKIVSTDFSYSYSGVVSILVKPSINFKVLGNPFSNELTVSYQSAILQPVKLSLFDTNGKLITSIIRNGSGVPETYTFKNLKVLKPGMYIVDIHSGEKRNASVVMKAE